MLAKLWRKNFLAAINSIHPPPRKAGNKKQWNTYNLKKSPAHWRFICIFTNTPTTLMDTGILLITLPMASFMDWVTLQACRSIAPASFKEGGVEA